MPGQRQAIDVHRVHVDRNLAHGLHRIGVEDHVALVADLANLGDRLNYADLVVRKHDGDQDGLVVDGPLQVFEVDQAVRLHRQIGDAIAILFQPLAGIEHRLVLGYLGDDVVAALAVHLGNALDGQVVALGRAGGEDDLLGGRANQLCHLLAGLFDRLLGFPAKGVVAAGRVAEFRGEVGHHRLKHARIHGRGGVVIHVDRQLHVCRRLRCLSQRCSFALLLLIHVNLDVLPQPPRLTNTDSTVLPWYLPGVLGLTQIRNPNRLQHA